MESTESKESRIKRVDMHDYFLNRIHVAMKSKNYIEATWLIYACLENRYFRTVSKYREKCKYCRSKSKCNKKDRNELAITTKIKCVNRLYDAGTRCIVEAFDKDIFKETIDWVQHRNDLMHDLLSLEYYENTDEMFKKLAEDGLDILNRTYSYCTKFRALFYEKDYEFVMPDEVSENCPCKPTKNSNDN